MIQASMGFLLAFGYVVGYRFGEKMEETLMFRFGFISDIQYADIDDAMNFSKTEHRGYRDALHHVKKAVSFWNSQVPLPAFVVQVGDIIDGQNSGTYGQGVSFSAPQSNAAFLRVIAQLEKSMAPVYHVIGNHELYNFSWQELRALGNRMDGRHTIAKEEMFFSFRPHKAWCCIVLNSYAVSIMQDEKSEGYAEAHRILSQRNNNFLSQGKKDYFEGLVGRERRFVPFNGGLGEKQCRWLKNELATCRRLGEKVLIFVHNPLHAGAASDKNLAFDDDVVMEILHEHGAENVMGVFAGHYHRGGYVQDEEGIHHLTIQSPLTHGECFGFVDVYSNRMEIHGQGAHRSHICHFGVNR